MCSSGVIGSNIINNAIKKLGRKLKINFINFLSMFSILFSIISNRKIKGKKNTIGSQIKIAKTKKTVSENIL